MINSSLNFLLYRTPLFFLIQSVWRDEAFSYFMAKPNVLRIIINTANDFNPPLYYLLLHFWIYLAGNNDALLRIISLLPHLASVYLAYTLGVKLTNKKFAFFIAAFTLFNPMLLYYAFEIRMYSLYAFLTMGVIYFFYQKNWKWFTIFAVLGLYTHSFFILILVSFILYLLLSKQFNKTYYWSIVKPILFFLPWAPIITLQFLRSKESWLFPVDLQLIKSAIGNLFTNYEGTPGNLWKFTSFISLVILIFFLLSLREKRKKPLLFLTPIFAPLAIILGYSVIVRPLYVNRYLIFISVFEILAVSLGIYAIRNKLLKSMVAYGWLIFIIFFNIYITPFRQKTDFKGTFMEINQMADNEDFVYAKTPIGFLESAFYYKNTGQVFVYNPQKIKIPDYIGVNVAFPDISKDTYPPSPSRTYLVHDDANFEIIIIK